MSIISPAVRGLLLTKPKWARDPLWRRAQQVPACDIDFTRQSIVDFIGGITPTFTRAGSTKLAWNGSQFVSYAADVPAFQLAADGVWEYLHETAATNLYLNSSAPATQSITVTAQQYTLSFYGTGTLTLSGVSTAGPLVGTGAEPSRVSLTFTPSAGSLTLTLSGSISKPQLETGSSATSPILTAGSTALRAADFMTVTGTSAADLIARLGSSYWLYADVGNLTASTTGSQAIFSLSDNTTAERLHLRASGVNARSESAVITGGVSQAVLTETTGAWPAGIGRKVAGAYSLNNIRLATPAGLYSDTLATMPTVDRVSVGVAPGHVSPYMGIRRLSIFSGVPSDAILAAMVA